MLNRILDNHLHPSLPLSPPLQHTYTRKSPFLLHHDHPLIRSLHTRPPRTGGVRFRRRVVPDRPAPPRTGYCRGGDGTYCCRGVGDPLRVHQCPSSWVLKDLEGCCVLANHGKTPESGRIFGEIVASRLLPRGLIHLECSDKTLYAWNRPVDREVRDIAAKTGFDIVPATVSEKGRSGERTIRGCIPGRTGLCGRDRHRACYRAGGCAEVFGRNDCPGVGNRPKTPRP